jgi:hypothetical protein
MKAGLSPLSRNPIESTQARKNNFALLAVLRR